jgi:hypothetical protein
MTLVMHEIHCKKPTKAKAWRPRLILQRKGWKGMTAEKNLTVFAGT